MLKIDIWNIAFTVINLLILFFLLKKFLFKPIISIMEKREQMIRESIDSAEKDKSEAEKMLQKAKENLDSSLAEAEKLSLEKLSAAQEEYDRIIDSAKKEADGILESGRARASVERKKMMDGAREDIISAAVETAEKLADTKSDRQRASVLFDELIEKAGKAK